MLSNVFDKMVSRRMRFSYEVTFTILHELERRLNVICNSSYVLKQEKMCFKAYITRKAN